MTGEQGRSAKRCWRCREWPTLDGLADDKAEAEIGWVIDLVTAIRSVRAEMNITAAIPLVLAGASAETQGARRALGRIHQAAGARVGDFLGRDRAAGLGAACGARRSRGAAAQRRHRSRRRARPAAKEMAKADADIDRVDAKLGNANFVANAPEEVVEEEKEKRDGGGRRARPRSPRRWSGSRGAA